MAPEETRGPIESLPAASEKPENSVGRHQRPSNPRNQISEPEQLNMSLSMRKRKHLLVSSRGPLDPNHRWVWMCGFKTILRSMLGHPRNQPPASVVRQHARVDALIAALP